MVPRDVARTIRRNELHDLAAAAKVEGPAGLALALDAAERQAGWRVSGVQRGFDCDGGELVVVGFERCVRPLPREEVMERIRAERREGASFRAIARGLERDAIPAPSGAPTWHPATVFAYVNGGWKRR